MVNIFGIIILNTIFNYIVYECYSTYKNSEKDQIIEELLDKIDGLEDQLLKKNEFIANELQSDFQLAENELEK